MNEWNYCYRLAFTIYGISSLLLNALQPTHVAWYRCEWFVSRWVLLVSICSSEMTRWVIYDKKQFGFDPSQKPHLIWTLNFPFDFSLQTRETEKFFQFSLTVYVFKEAYSERYLDWLSIVLSRINSWQIWSVKDVPGNWIEHSVYGKICIRNRFNDDEVFTCSTCRSQMRQDSRSLQQLKFWNARH